MHDCKSQGSVVIGEEMECAAVPSEPCSIANFNASVDSVPPHGSPV